MPGHLARAERIGMTFWQDFYQSIKDPSWPDCDREEDFAKLPRIIQDECQQVFGYQPGQFARQPKFMHKPFPIRTATACQLKWNWSTIYLTTEHTASCHRTAHHRFDSDSFNFHNTTAKQADRKRMLAGEWPERGCDYCKQIETAGGQSDRLTNLDLPGMHAPMELEQDPSAVIVTPRILEVYFDNTCNLKCLYCGPHFSSLWDAENIQHGLPAFAKSPNIDRNKQKMFEWLRANRQHLTNFNILGGEPLYQRELLECLDFFQQYPAPDLSLQIFTNLNAKRSYLEHVVERVQDLIAHDCLRNFEVTASLDCWGAPAEYVRFPLDLDRWQSNFEYLLDHPNINLIVSSTVTPLTVVTLPDLIAKINQWNQVRPIYHYQNSVNSPSYLFIDIFGDIFQDDFQRAIDLKPTETDEQRKSRDYLIGIARQSCSVGPNVKELAKLHDFLQDIDRRRDVSWRRTFPWLEEQFRKHGILT